MRPWATLAFAEDENGAVYGSRSAPGFDAFAAETGGEPARLLLVPCNCPADADHRPRGRGGLSCQLHVKAILAALRTWEARFAASIVEVAPAMLVLAVGAPRKRKGGARGHRRDGRVLTTRGHAPPGRPQGARGRAARHPTSLVYPQRPALAPGPLATHLRGPVGPPRAADRDQPMRRRTPCDHAADQAAEALARLIESIGLGGGSSALRPRSSQSRASTSSADSQPGGWRSRAVSRASAWSSSLTGVRTPCSRPRRTISPLR